MKVRYLIFAIGLLIAVFLYFYYMDIKQYFEYREVCDEDFGFKKYGDIHKGKGWFTLGYFEASYIANLDGVHYVRYPGAGKKSHINYDIRYIGGDVRVKSSYKKMDANYGFKPSYTIVSNDQYSDEENCIKRSSIEVSDYGTGRLLGEYVDYSYHSKKFLISKLNSFSCNKNVFYFSENFFKLFYQQKPKNGE